MPLPASGAGTLASDRGGSGADRDIAEARHSSPLVTVIMPAYNGERFIAGAIRSILDQTFPDFELIVVDDGSMDGTQEIVSGFSDPRVKLLANERNLGSARAANRAVAEARGRYIARMDQDDLSHPSRLERQVKFLGENEDVALVGSSALIIDEAGKRLGEWHVRTDPAEIDRVLLLGNQVMHPSVMVRREMLLKVGGYSLDPRVAYSRDYDLSLRLAEISKLANLPEMLVSYRMHANQMTRRMHRNRKSVENCRIMAHYRRRLVNPGALSSAAFRVSRAWASARGRPGTLGWNCQQSAIWFRYLGLDRLACGAALWSMVHAPLSAQTWTEGARTLANIYLAESVLRLIRRLLDIVRRRAG